MDAGHGCGTGKYKVISETYPYSQVMCWIDCILAFVFEKCGCLGVEMTDEVPIGKSFLCQRSQLVRAFFVNVPNW